MSDATPNLSADPELLAGFFDETRDQLANINDQVVSLESAPNALPVIESIFRTAHSIKGNAAFFGFLRAKALAHRLENVLDAMRKGRLTADNAVITTLLSGFDLLIAIFERVRSGGVEVSDQIAYDAVIESIGVQEGRASAGDKPDWERIRKDIAAAEAALTPIPDDARINVQALIRHLRAMDPGAKAAAPAAAKHAAGPMADLAAILDPPLDGVLDPERSKQVRTLLDTVAAAAGDDAAKALAAEMIDGYNTFVEAMGFDPMLRDFLRERLAQVPNMAGFAALKPKEEPKPQPKAEPAGESKGDGKSAASSEAGKTMRVSESKIDTFLHYVGELLVVGDMFDHLQGRALALSDGAKPAMHHLARDLRRANETFGELSNKLQTAIMGIRKVPIRPLLTKVPRIVRDAAQAKGKEVLVKLEGEDVDIDKSLVDLLDAPLTHMSRNAADHGVEKPEVREAAGKPRQGTILVRAAETSSSIVVTIEDDGAGLNLERIRAKAESMGLMKPGATMGEQDIINCIFAPGLSTAEQVTDISGRGVGMDVVKRSIEEAGGSIQISTENGKGSRFVITLPKRVTTQILPGYLLRLRNQLFVVPLDRVRETFRIKQDEITSVAGRGSCILRHDEVLPLLPLTDALGLGYGAPGNRRTVVTVEARRKRIAVEVDQVIGVQKVVIRSIEGLPATNDLLAGGALMGDGGVALILNLDALVPESA